MDFHEWVGSEEITAKNYRWNIISCGMSSRDAASEAAKNAFEAGREIGLQEATHEIVRRLTETI